ncbi:hypothetical protein [Novosphingobium sp. 9U]|uniref:hypothetical protein n=1 Tax=Novosphingobium sp. 9U TaxID=2653158 RepID=UPI0013584A4F|nr:hypothetical protein [Novosphingobium sp. 9U]
MIDDAAISRIRDMVAHNITLNCPKRVNRSVYRQEVGRRLEEILQGERKVSDINELLHIDEEER